MLTYLITVEFYYHQIKLKNEQFSNVNTYTYFIRSPNKMTKIRFFFFILI